MMGMFNMAQGLKQRDDTIIKQADEISELRATCRKLQSKLDQMSEAYIIDITKANDVIDELRAELASLHVHLDEYYRDEAGYINACHDAEPTTDNELRERLAAVSHEIWASWMTYLFLQCEDEIDGTGYVIEFSIAKHWLRQIRTPYATLTEREKDSDREQADKIIEVLRDVGVK